MLDLCTLDGKIIALPQVYTGLVMWYRTDILEQYGLEVPKTFEELENICEVLKENGQASFSTGGWHIFRYLEALLEYYAGPEEHDALNTLEADWGSSEAVTQAFAKLKEWGDKGYFIDGYVTEDANNAKMYVFGGTSAMLWTTPEWLPTLWPTNTILPSTRSLHSLQGKTETQEGFLPM